MIDVDVDLATGDVSVVERPPAERLVEVGNDLFLLSVEMFPEPSTDFGQFRHQWRTNGALGCDLDRIEELSVLEVTRLQPRLDLPASREVPESLVDVDMADVVERT